MSKTILLAVAFIAVGGFQNATSPAFAASKEKVLHSFGKGKYSDGAGPHSGLILDSGGDLYGTTSTGDGDKAGTVFELVPGQEGKWTEKTLHTFVIGKKAGARLVAGMIFDEAGNLYGTTYQGGLGTHGPGGTVFELVPSGSGKWTETTLYNFCTLPGCVDGEQPYAGLIFDKAGNLYGTTDQGGAYDNGTVFELSPGANGTWNETVLYSFCSVSGCADGSNPRAGVILDTDGNLYGTTSASDFYGSGTVFELTPNAEGTWTETVLHSFSGADGANPWAGLVFDAAGNLYGTTTGGGAYGLGTVYELTSDGNGTWAETVLYSFCSVRACADGLQPYSGLVLDAVGNLYGTTTGGGAHSSGVVFKLTPSANAMWAERILHAFGKNQDGALPFAGLTFDSSGNLYGTTSTGGNYGRGTVFEVTP